jgi:DNA invertase Pin-like site-specific DNA recombinase
VSLPRASAQLSRLYLYPILYPNPKQTRQEERVSAGIRNARANGKKLGRPKSAADRERILQLKVQGHSLRQIAAKLGVGYGTVRERLKGE